MQRLQIVISHWSQVLEPSPQGVLRQQMRRCLFGTLTGPVILTAWALALATSWLVTCCMGGRRLPEKVMRVRFTSWSSIPSFLSLSAIFIINISIIKKKQYLQPESSFTSMQGRNKYKQLSLLIGRDNVDNLKQMNILVVGAGGIGCELLKNISKMPVRRVTILDYDLIEETNLNRQFYFRKEHVGMPKVTVLKQQLSKIAPEIQVTAICDNLYNKKYNDVFFSQFSLIVSALDSIKARQYLASKATRNGKALIDAGTMSYHGQAYAAIRFITTCHNCQPSSSQDNGVACLIRSRPERPIHCGTYAKSFYQSFFGEKGDTMSDRLRSERFLPKNMNIQNQGELRSIAENLFTELFDEGIIDEDLSGYTIEFIRKLKLQEALQSKQIVENTEKASQKTLKKQKYEEDELWSISKYTQTFISSFSSLIKRKYINKVPCTFQKDDQDCMTFVCCITNLRTYNFINSKDSKLKYLTYYQCKDMVGKVMPAIASSNAIAAALEMRQIVNIATNRLDRLRIIHFTNIGKERLSPCYQSDPLLTCNFCSSKIVYAKVLLDMNKILFGEFQEFAEKQLFSFGRDVMSGPYAIIKNSKKGAKPNKSKPISFVEQMIHDGVLQVSFNAGLQGTPISVHVSIIHQEGIEGIRTIDTPTKQELRLQIVGYFRKLHEEKTMMEISELKFKEEGQF